MSNNNVCVTLSKDDVRVVRKALFNAFGFDEKDDEILLSVDNMLLGVDHRLSFGEL